MVSMASDKTDDGYGVGILLCCWCWLSARRRTPDVPPATCWTTGVTMFVGIRGEAASSQTGSFCMISLYGFLCMIPMAASRCMISLFGFLCMIGCW